jgi:hypothetical protein
MESSRLIALGRTPRRVRLAGVAKDEELAEVEMYLRRENLSRELSSLYGAWKAGMGNLAWPPR